MFINWLNILVYDKYLEVKKNRFKFTNLSNLLKNSDIISLHIPLSNETKNLINKSSFLKMKKKPIVINTSRGSIINEKELIDAYDKNLISVC